MNCIHDNEVNKIDECNLLHVIINPSNRTKNINSHYSPIIYGCMNTQKGRPKFKIIQILLDNGCSSITLIRRLMAKIIPKKTL